MTKKLRYHGFRFCNCIAVDNREYYQSLLKRDLYDKKLQEAARSCDLIELGKPYTRLVAHKVAVYRVNNPVWESRGKFAVPCGELETILELDLGIEFMAAMTSTREVVVKEKAEHYLPDGSIIKGKITKLVPGESQLEKLADFLEIQHDLGNRRRREEQFGYSFGIKKEAINLANPLEFHVEEYVKIDNNLLGSPEREVVIVARVFSPPHYPNLIYRKTSPNKILKSII